MWNVSLNNNNHSDQTVDVVGLNLPADCFYSSADFSNMNTRSYLYPTSALRFSMTAGQRLDSHSRKVTSLKPEINNSLTCLTVKDRTAVAVSHLLQDPEDQRAEPAAPVPGENQSDRCTALHR